MAINQKTETVREADASDLPTGLDVLTEDQERANLPLDEIFRRHPSLSMLAQVLTDFIVRETSVKREYLKVSLLERDGASGIAFSAFAFQDGSIDADVHDALHEAFDSFQQTSSRHMLEQGDQIVLYPQNFFIGTGNEKIGLVAFLYALAQDNDIHIGPDTDGKRKPSVGAFTITDIVHAIKDEEEKRDAQLKEEFALANANNVLPQPPVENYDTMLEKAKHVSKVIDAALGGAVFNATFFQTKHGYRMTYMPKDTGASADTLDGFFEKIEQAELPEGISVSREMSVIGIKDAEAFQQFFDLAMELHPLPEEPEVAADHVQTLDEEERHFLWARSAPTNAVEAAAEALYGLARFHYDAGDHVHWRIDMDEGVWRLAAQLPEGMEGFAGNLEDMLIDLQNKGGEWEGLSVLPSAYAIEFVNPSTFALMLEKYAQEHGVYFGDAALKICESSSYDEGGKLILAEEDISAPLSDDELCEAQMMIEEAGEDEEVDPEDAPAIDPTVLNMLNNRQYSSHNELYRDIARINRLIDSDFYGGPYGPAEIYTLLKQQKKIEAEPAPAPGIH